MFRRKRDEPVRFLNVDALRLGPDEVLVLKFPDSTTYEQLEDCQRALHRQRPELRDRILFVANVEVAAALRECPTTT